MNTIEITKDKWEDYRNCQENGTFNMLDWTNYNKWCMTSLNRGEWFEIVKNYKKYKELFG